MTCRAWNIGSPRRHPVPTHRIGAGADTATVRALVDESVHVAIGTRTIGIWWRDADREFYETGVDDQQCVIRQRIGQLLEAPMDSGRGAIVFVPPDPPALAASKVVRLVERAKLRRQRIEQ